jgi:hypothetical protein
VIYSYAGTQNISAVTYYNLTLAGSGNKFLSSSVIVNGTLAMKGTAVTLGTTPTYGGAATLEYSGTGAQTTSSVEFPSPFNYKLNINNTSGVTLDGPKSVTLQLPQRICLP